MKAQVTYAMLISMLVALSFFVFLGGLLHMIDNTSNGHLNQSIGNETAQLQRWLNAGN